MTIIRLIPVILSCLLMSAHFSRADITGLAIVWLILPLLLFVKRRWIAIVFQALMSVAALEWIRTTINLAQIRDAGGEPWTRLVIILVTVSLFSLASILVFRNPALKTRFQKSDRSDTATATAFLLSAGLLSVVQIMVPLQILIIERFFPTFGWLEILALASYAAWITSNMLDPARSPIWRHRIWTVFSIFFFAQLITGLSGVDAFLMTGKLHLPVPLMILAGPIYRGGGFFMPILFLSTILLVGPAWCSHLCYIGAWDNIAANRKKTPGPLPAWSHPLRIGILVLTILTAILLRLMGISAFRSVITGAMFGILGIGVTIFLSSKTGAMIHCITWCPIGLLANWFGRLNPFRIKIADSCNDCGACSKTCRYNALGDFDIRARRAGLTCTLCGDCIQSCPIDSIGYRVPGLDPDRARTVFMVLIAVLHVVFMGSARI